MDLEQIKQEIADRTGLTTDLLKGETVEENIAQAKALLAYKREYEAKRPKSTAEQFTEWAGANFESGAERTARILGLSYEQPQDAATAALDEIAERARVEAGGYPMTKDGGEVTGLPDPRPARDQFAEWIGQHFAFDPRNNGGGNW